MTKLTGAALDRAVANALGVKSVHDCEKWGEHMTEEDEEFQRLEREAKMRRIVDEHIAKVTSDIDLAVNKALAEEDDDIQVYKKPWVGLTDEEIADCAEKMEASDPTDSFWREFFRGIEAKLKEKNT